MTMPSYRLSPAASNSAQSIAPTRSSMVEASRWRMSAGPAERENS